MVSLSDDNRLILLILLALYLDIWMTFQTLITFTDFDNIVSQYTLQSSNLIKLNPLIPRLCF